MSGAVHLSLVIPAYNEERRIGDTLEQVQAYLRRQPYTWEVIVVNDGSRDATAEAARRVLPRVRVLDHRPNRGKGYAVKLGMQSAHGAIRVFYDADGSTPIEEIEKLWPEFEHGADIVIGSRALPQSKIEVHQPWYRENMGRAYNLLLRILRLTHFPDTQCGFKGFTANACGVVYPRQTLNGFGSDCEMLYIAQVHGLKVVEVPVRWVNNPDTRVNAFFDSLDMVREVLLIRFRSFLGRYK